MDKGIGERIAHLRKDSNMSMAQFGKMVGISGQHLGMVEKGITGLSIDTTMQICEKTGASADFVLFGINDPISEVAKIVSTVGLSKEQLQITLDIVKKVADFVSTENGNEALVREVLSCSRTT